MDRPEDKDKSTPTTEPDPAPKDTAAAFFPDFATVRVALDAGHIGVWSWDIATNAVTWSSNIESICGLSPGAFDGTYSFFERDIHEEDRPKVLEAVGEALRTGGPYWVRYRAEPREGRRELWIEASGTVTIRTACPSAWSGCAKTSPSG
jgi:PAS domain-containing protein